MLEYDNNSLLTYLCLFIAIASVSLSVFATIDNYSLIKIINEVELDTPAPYSIISREQIIVYNDYTIINESDLDYFTVKDTNSMLPFIDNGNYVLAKKIELQSDIHIGDIITYNSKRGSYVMHRVVNISEDDKGIFYTLRGDNNKIVDDEKVRFDQTVYRIAAVIY